MRNIVLLTLDSLRADHCGFAGYKRQTTPTIDRMAEDGIHFDNAISPSTATPTSMIGIFTGEYSSVDITASTPGKGASSEPWREEINRRTTLAQFLSEKGYSTAAINPNVFSSSYFGFNRGFHQFQDFLSIPGRKSGGVSISERIFDRHLQGKVVASYVRTVLNLIRREEVFKPWDNFYGDIIKAVRDLGRPFFLWILSLDVHHPYLVPRRFRVNSNTFDMYYYNLLLETGRLRKRSSERGRERIIDSYDDSIRYADSFVKRLWEDLMDEDPIFVIHSDHGEGFGEHGFYSHPPRLYEENIHVPLVIHNAGVRKRVKEPVSLLGISPTILELIGEQNVFPSHSLLGRSECWVISKVLDKGREKIAVRMKDWKLIVGQKEEDELYCLDRDPYEQKNLLSEKPGLAGEMRKIAEINRTRGTESRRILNRISRLG